MDECNNNNNNNNSTGEYRTRLVKRNDELAQVNIAAAEMPMLCTLDRIERNALIYIYIDDEL